MWNSSNCDCKCNKACKINKYLDIKKFSYKKDLLDKLALAWEDENKIKINEKSHKNIVIYQIKHVPVKDLSFKKNNSVNPL